MALMPWLDHSSLGDYYRESLIEQLSDQDNGVVNTQLSAARKMIESHIRKDDQFSTPLRDDEVDELLEKIQADLAVHGLFERLGVEVPDGIQKAYAAAMNTLARFQSGELTIPTADEGEPNAGFGMSFRRRTVTETDGTLPSSTPFYGGPSRTNVTIRK